MEELSCTKGYNNGAVFQKCFNALVSKTSDVQFIFESKNKNENENEGVKIPANKCVLAAVSPVFDAMFNGDLKEGAEVKIVDATPGAFQEFMQFFYGYRVNLTMENIAEVLKLVDKYDVADFLHICVDFLKSNLPINDIIWGLHLAIKFHLDDLKPYCEDKIQDNYKIVFEMFNFDDDKLSVNSNGQLSDKELENIYPHIIAISHWTIFR